MISHSHEVFLEVAQRLSFTKASQSLFISQSAVSKQIKALEERYKTGLFERLGSSILLTPAGRKLYEKLLQAKQLQQELHQEMSELSTEFAPTLHLAIGASTTISLYVLPPVVSAYLRPQFRQYPARPARPRNRAGHHRGHSQGEQRDLHAPAHRRCGGRVRGQQPARAPHP
jgi:DNA-binding transcriptional LysR family regulator